MKKFVLIGLIIMMTAGESFAFDPPRVIGVLTSPQEEPNGFATDFCWVGDQNGDGYDDLLVNQDRNDTLNSVYLFQGGDTIVNEPAFTWTSYESGLIVGRNIVFLGHVDERADRVAFFSFKRNSFIAIDQYSLGHEPNSNPLNGMRGVQREGASLVRYGYMKRPTDFNGDGFKDFIFIKQVPPTPTLQVSYGGESFDTLPDWEVDPKVTMGLSGDVRISAGFDVNGDGFDDMLVYTRGDTNYYSFYLGGFPPDTVPALRIRANDYNLGNVFAMLLDVNGDGYDDWGISWYNARDVNNTEAGVKIFFGGEVLDGEFDLNFQSPNLRFVTVVGLCGGNLNGDGAGDIVIMDGGGLEESITRMMIHFGNRWIVDGHEPDIYVRNMTDEYDISGGLELGAVGDYNGDRIDDFVIRAPQSAIILAGNHNWRLDTSKGTPRQLPVSQSLSATPNPFNSSTTIRYSTSPINREATSLRVYDLSGREVALLSSETLNLRAGGGGKSVGCGDPTVSRVVWDAADFTAGIYFVRLETGREVASKKVVLMK